MPVVTLPDVERIIGSPHGHIPHGELQPNMLFFASAYPRSIRAVPSAGVTGHNAARETLRKAHSGEFRHKGLAAQSA